ncbi:hypothetical protein pdam_00008329 [Pocillopora damicornis]|uniref:Importin N-terminal domain-containing protein n=1 Tax=Pocillopora damicornis TaxID=46731 RepID=A0A3M6U5X6_POCDA|nr:hypothetical protein pdam_00008329 [Pocillopora damicornis]
MRKNRRVYYYNFYTGTQLEKFPQIEDEERMNEAWRDALLLALNHACSQNPSLTKEAEDKLKSWEREPGYYSLLMIIFKNKTLDVNIRWMAMVLMKNGVERYWRKSAPQ